MSSFNPTNLSVTFWPPVTPLKPVDGRKYTLTHSDSTGNLFLTIGYSYDTISINSVLRDEVLAEWIPQMGQYVLCGRVHISDGNFDQQYSRIRLMIFKREMNLALTAMVYGDRELLLNYPWLLDSPIYIHYQSDYPEFNQVQYYGTPRFFLATAQNQGVS